MLAGLRTDWLAGHRGPQEFLARGARAGTETFKGGVCGARRDGGGKGQGLSSKERGGPRTSEGPGTQGRYNLDRRVQIRQQESEWAGRCLYLGRDKKEFDGEAFALLQALKILLQRSETGRH